MRVTSIITASLATALLCGIAVAQRTPGGDANPGLPTSAPQPAALPAPTGQYPQFPSTLSPRPLALLISSWPMCGSDNGQEVRIAPPSNIPPSLLNLGLANLVFVEPTWSLTDVKRAVRMMGATGDPSARQLLEIIAANARTIVERRSVALARTLTRDDRQAFDAWLRNQTTDLQRVVREQLSPR